MRQILTAITERLQPTLLAFVETREIFATNFPFISRAFHIIWRRLNPDAALIDSTFSVLSRYHHFLEVFLRTLCSRNLKREKSKINSRSYFKQSCQLNCRSFHICLNEEKCDNEIFGSKRLFIWQIIHANARNFRCKFQLESHYASPLDLTALRAPKSLEIFTAKCRTTEQHQNTKTFVLRIYTSFIYFFSFLLPH